MDNLEIYRVNVDETEDSSLIYGISLVDEPANMSMFITMTEDKKEVIKLEKEKRQITGVVLIPNQKIFRFDKNTNKEFYLVFEDEEIRLLSRDFFKNGYQKNSNINHNDKEVINGLTFFESWIVEDPLNDKSNALGFKDLPKGTWMATAYVEEDTVWEKAKSGEVKGFSIEAFLDFSNIKLKTNKTEKMSLLKKLITMFSEDEGIKVLQIETSVGMLTVDSLEEGSMVLQELNTITAPFVSQSFSYEGMNYTTDEDGKISLIEAVEVVVEEMEEVVVEDETVIETIVEDIIEEVAVDVEEDVVVNWEEVVQNITKQLEDVLKENKDLVTEIVELKKQPSTTKLSAHVSNNNKETRLERLSRIVNK